MIRYSPIDEPNTERALLIQIEHGANTDFSHIVARVVRDSAPDVEGDYSKPSDGRNARGWRWAGWTSAAKSALFVEDLQIRAQMDAAEMKPYCAKYQFHEVYYLEPREARHIVRTFDALDKGLAKLDDELGCRRDDDFTELCIRAALVMKIKKFLIVKDTSYRNLTDARTAETTARDLRWHIENLIDSQKQKAAA